MPDCRITHPTTMRALVLNGTGFEHLQIREVPVPHPGPRQVLARVDAAGICTSLIKLVEQGPAHKYLYGWDVSQFPLILGDEGSVTLIAIGAELSGQYQAGQRFVIQPAVDHPPVNHCERYRNNAKGVHKVAVGYTLPGHLAEYILITEEIIEAGCLLPLPNPVLPYAHAAMGEPLSCIISGQDHHVHLCQNSPFSERIMVKGLKPGGVTVIVGAGAMGRMHVDLALSYHPRAIIVTDFIDERLEQVTTVFGPRAKQLSVTLYAVNSARMEVKNLINELTADHGADDVIVAVGSGKAIEMAQYYAGRGAVLNLFGGLKAGQEIVKVDSNLIHYKEINVIGSSGGSPWDVARTLSLMATGDIDPATHITRIGDLDHVIEFLKMVQNQKIDGKAVVYPHRRTAEISVVDSWTADDERRYLAGEDVAQTGLG